MPNEKKTKLYKLHIHYVLFMYLYSLHITLESYVKSLGKMINQRKV